jgi:hypothetical protein
MKAMKIALAAAAATVALSGAAMAEELKLSYNLGVTSDYVFRGVSQTQERSGRPRRRRCLVRRFLRGRLGFERRLRRR